MTAIRAISCDLVDRIPSTATIHEITRKLRELQRLLFLFMKSVGTGLLFKAPLLSGIPQPLKIEFANSAARSRRRPDSEVWITPKRSTKQHELALFVRFGVVSWIRLAWEADLS